MFLYDIFTSGLTVKKKKKKKILYTFVTSATNLVLKWKFALLSFF